MSDGFDLDLRNAEAELPEDVQDQFEGRVVLGVLDGTTDPTEWVEYVADGAVLVLSIQGDLNELAAPFAADLKRDGASLVQFRDFLVVTPPGVDIDSSRVG